jgi:uncharacterized membrane protein YoaK (UPF0700 family)
VDGNSVSHASTSEASCPLLVALFGLTFVTGVIDAVSFLGLGHVFTANMTGNVVFLGFAMGGTADLSVGRSLAALCAFASGSVVGGRLINERHRTPARQLLIAMYAEVLFLCLAAGATLTAGGETFARLYLVIVVTALAMGLRNAVVRKLAVPDLTTTVLTLTVTGLAADSGLAGGAAPRSGRRMLSILTMCGGALVGTTLLRRLGMWVPLIVAALVVAGLALYLYLSERSKHEIVLKVARAMARRADDPGDDGTNDLLVSDVIRRNELQLWPVAEHVVGARPTRA